MLPEHQAVRAYTISGFCAAYGIGRTLAYREIAAGRLKASKAGKRTLIRLIDAERWANALPPMTAGPVVKSSR